MRKISLFMNVSLDGFFEAPGHDLSWAHSEFGPFNEESQTTDAILLGHRTYEMMKSFWPTPQAAASVPAVAKFMNEQRKLVASHAPFEPGWKNVTVLSGNVPEEVRSLKTQPGGGIIMLGSNSLCVSLMQAGLVDEFQIMVNPVAIGSGTPLFHGLAQRTALTLKGIHEYPSGAVLLSYAPAR